MCLGARPHLYVCPLAGEGVERRVLRIVVHPPEVVGMGMVVCPLEMEAKVGVTSSVIRIFQGEIVGHLDV